MFGFKKKYKIEVIFTNDTDTLSSKIVACHLERYFTVSINEIITETQIYPAIGDIIVTSDKPNSGFSFTRHTGCVRSRIIDHINKTITYNLF